MAEKLVQKDNEELPETTTSKPKFSLSTENLEDDPSLLDDSIALLVEDPEVEGDHFQLLPPPPPEPILSSISLTNAQKGSSVYDCKSFRIEILGQCLDSCIRSTDGELDMDSYLDSFKEICKLLDNLGTVIRAYIGGDIKQKISLIKKHKAGQNGSFYETIEKMVTFEKQNRIHVSDVVENGSRTVLRLHRSLHFVLEFLRSLNRLNPEQGLGSAGREVYNKTLAPYHPWAYKKIARLALSTLGGKKSLVANFHDGSMTSSQLHSVIESVVTAATRVHNHCQTIYEQHDFLDLP